MTSVTQNKLRFIKINNNYLGVLFILLHASLDVLFYAICKYDSKNNYSNSVMEEIIFVFAYNFKSLIILIIFFLIKYLINNNLSPKERLSTKIDSANLKIYAVMSFFSVVGFIIFLYGLQDMMIANAMSIKYIEQILWVIVGVILLNERLSSKQVLGILVSISGVGIIIISHLEVIDKIITYFLPVFAAICWTISSNLGKHLIKNEKNILVHMVYYYIFHVLILCFLFVIFILYSNINIEEVHINLGSYEFLIHILSMTFFYKALKVAPISLLAPFVYVKLIVSALLGYFIFLDIYNSLELFAYILIIYGGLMVLNTLNYSKFIETEIVK
ncbi:membrane protein (plasmid) [Candidatus Megaera polyxenophila]|nr:membrane protein [Candidatus Megaera polyxenophila]